MSDAQQYVQDIIDLHQGVHGQLWEAISGLGTEALNWTPGPETSSIGTIVVHALGAQAEMLRHLLGIPTNRSREAEFERQTHARDDLLRLIDAAEQDLRELAPHIGESTLRSPIPRPGKPVPQTGLFWLVRNYGHMREHMAQVLLTEQLFRMR